MMAFSMIVWGLLCLIAATGTVLIFKSEDNQTISGLRAHVRRLQTELTDEKRCHEVTRSRLSQLTLVDEPYDQTKDHGPARLVPAGPLAKR